MHQDLQYQSLEKNQQNQHQLVKERDLITHDKHLVLVYIQVLSLKNFKIITNYKISILINVILFTCVLYIGLNEKL